MLELERIEILVTTVTVLVEKLRTEKLLKEEWYQHEQILAQY